MPTRKLDKWLMNQNKIFFIIFSALAGMTVWSVYMLYVLDKAQQIVWPRRNKKNVDVNGMEEADFLLNNIKRILMRFLKREKNLKTNKNNMAGVLMLSSIKEDKIASWDTSQS